GSGVGDGGGKGGGDEARLGAQGPARNEVGLEDSGALASLTAWSAVAGRLGRVRRASRGEKPPPSNGRRALRAARAGRQPAPSGGQRAQGGGGRILAARRAER